MPTLNEAEYIERAVGSILDQTYSELELIIIDDGSTDGTIERINEFDDNRIRLICRSNGSGITSALNRGLKEANGEYIARHDADDWSEQIRFKQQVDVLTEHPQIALLGTGAYLVDETGAIISQRRVLNKPEIYDLIEHNEFIHGSVMMRRDSLESIGGYDEWFETAEDYDLWLRLADEYEVRNIDEPLYYFRQHDESLYGSNLEELKLYHLLAVRRVTVGLDEPTKSLINDHGIKALYDDLDDEERRWFHTELAREFIRYGDLEAGRTHVLKALRLSPLSVTRLGMLLLTATTPRIAGTVAGAYRRLINVVIRLRNRRS